MDNNTITPAIEVNNFGKIYSKKDGYVVKDINIKIMPGEFHGFIGANGAGKTTTIKSLIGAYAKYEGGIKIFGYKNDSIEAKKRMGYIPENAAFPKELSALNYIKYMAHIEGKPLKEAKKYALSIIKQLGLEKLKNKNPNKFSSGQKKKVLLAQALIHNPEVLIMDEPAANLDPKARLDFFDKLRELQKEGKTVLIASHILSELDQFVDSVTILEGGKVAYSGKIKDIANNKNNMFEIMAEPDDLEKIKKYLKSKKVKFSVSNKKLIVELDKKKYSSLLKYIDSQDIILDSIQKIKVELSEIYRSAVVEGKEVKSV